MMLKSDVKKDIRKLLIDEDMTQAEMAVKAGTSAQYANRLLNSKDVVNGMFVKLVEAMGYDIEIRYVKREANDK